VLHLDYETRSELDLTEVGLDRYATHPSTRAILLGWAFDDDEVQVWECLRHPMPEPLRAAFQNPDTKYTAWNTSFERWISKHCLGIETRIDQWFDPKIIARYASIPGSLDECGKILNLPLDQRKIEGAKGEGGLIELFSLPCKAARAETLFGPLEAEFHDWEDKPNEWATFVEYCKRDVEVERNVTKALRGFKLPEREMRGWYLDQKINDAGMPVDMTLVTNALKIAVREKEQMMEELGKMTGLSNPNSDQQMLKWITERGYGFASMGKPLIARALAGEFPLTDECKSVLKLRQLAKKTSYTKYENILTRVGADARLRDQFAYLGSARAGRWASFGINLQNLPRPDRSVSKSIDWAVQMLREGRVEELAAKFPDLMAVATSCIRASFRAPDGKKLVVCDLGAIENRVLGWVADCDLILKVFRDKLDPYVSFGVFMYDEPYEVLILDKDKRQQAKPAVLGAGYRLGGGQLGTDRYGNEIKTGLWGYAANMGVEMSQEECQRVVAIFRETYHEVVQLWYDLEAASFGCLDGGRYEVGRCVFEAFGGTDRYDRKLMRITLPSGRCLHYIRPRIEKREFFGKPKDTFTYEGIDQLTRLWERTTTHGGKLTENIVQAIARDLLLNGMFLADDLGFEIVGTVHDEIISLVDVDSPMGVVQLRECMIAQPEWALDLPLDAEGYDDSPYYKKG
jgi:DNA polymerase